MRHFKRFSMAKPPRQTTRPPRRGRSTTWLAAALLPILGFGHAGAGPVRADTDALVQAQRAADARRALAAAKRAFQAGRYDEARPVLERAPDDPESLLMLARIHDGGLGGTAENPVLAVARLPEASQQGSAEATYRLGRHYAKGRGVRRSIGKATELYRKAALTGHAEAARHYQTLLGTKAGPGPQKRPERTPGQPEAASGPVSAPSPEDLALGGHVEGPAREPASKRPDGPGHVRMRPAEFTDFDF